MWGRTLLLFTTLMFVVGPGSAAAVEIVKVDVYVPVADGTKLRMQLERPLGAGAVPTLLFYHGYSHEIFDADPFVRDALERGYAVMVVSVRGAGCSGGSFAFLSAQEARDGRDAVEWIAGQDWSNGEVAMVGDSYTGFEQLPVAALRPDGLVAIAPGTPIADLYRDVAYPGGISNTFTPAAFSAVVLSGSATTAGTAALRLPSPVSQDCVAHQTGVPLGLAGTAAVLTGTHRWDDETMRARAPGAGMEQIDVPTFTLVAWQDETLGSRAIERLPDVSGPFHAIVSNGGHGFPNGIWYSRRAQRRLEDFLDFYVKGAGNGFGDRPPVEVWWEAQRRDGDVEPRWTSGLSEFPAPGTAAKELFLSSNGRLTAEPGTGGPDEYRYVGGTGQFRGDPAIPTTTDPATGQTIDWSGPPDEDKSLVYTSGPLEDDLAVLGPASADLWLDSTAPDTDVQVLVTEVRPDGQETYVQAGWLRASHRKLDAARSTPTRPFHTHQMSDTELLPPATPAGLRVEIRPFGHVFRRGSRVRLFIEAPPRTTGLWSLDSLPGPAVNRVHHDPEHPSVLRLATLPGQTAPVGLPDCGTVIRQPCRTAR
jgi:hypothetical protein